MWVSVCEGVRVRVYVDIAELMGIWNSDHDARHKYYIVRDHYLHNSLTCDAAVCYPMLLIYVQQTHM